jgi:RNA recognition motif-containing protein
MRRWVWVQEGVVLDAFERLAAGKVARSTTVLLVKNIPFSTTEAELRALFAPFGALVRVLLPPARTIALIEFAQPSEARTAFRQLAYTKFKVAVFIAPAASYTRRPWVLTRRGPWLAPAALPRVGADGYF